jgi:hypothetical protein
VLDANKLAAEILRYPVFLLSALSCHPVLCDQYPLLGAETAMKELFKVYLPVRAILRARLASMMPRRREAQIIELIWFAKTADTAHSSLALLDC